MTTLKDAMRNGSAVESGRESTRRTRKRTNERCSICTNRVWFDAVPLIEPEGVPEPRASWVLCQDCYAALIVEMRRSPVRSLLRLRIAIAIVASERWPHSYSPDHTSASDRRWILFIAWGFVIAMLIHLALIVMIAYIAR